MNSKLTTQCDDVCFNQAFKSGVYRHPLISRWDANIKTSLLALVLAFNLSGCVGFTFSKNGDVVVSEQDFSRVNFKNQSNPPARISDKINSDGSEMYVVQNEREWCGLTIWAIIPIPLWLPLCHVRTEVTYKNGSPTKMSSQWPKTLGGLCGPFVPIFGIGGGSQGFCRWDN